MEGIRNIPQAFTQGLENLKNAFAQGFEDLKNGIKSILIEIFVPSEDYISEKVNHIKEKFVFAESVINTADAFEDMFSTSSSEPPTLEINLGNAESKYNYGGKTIALDMTWYARYKPSVDAIVGSIMWVVFGWKLFIGLPNIIGGVGSQYNEVNTQMKDIKAGQRKKGK